MKKILLILTLGLIFGQTELTTRVYEMTIELGYDETIPFNVNELTGLDLDNPIVLIKSIDNLIVANGYDGTACDLHLVSLEQHYMKLCTG